MIELMNESAIACVLGLARACQLAALTVHRDLGMMSTLRMCADHLVRVPAPTSCAEAIVAATVLRRFTDQLGHQLHAWMHEKPEHCSFDPMITPLDAYVELAPKANWRAATVFEEWQDRFVSAIAQAHQSTLTARARALIARTIEKNLSVALIARELACSVGVLERRFEDDWGEGPLDYRTRMRVIAAVRLLRETTEKVDWIARRVGWKSRKDLNRALAVFTSMTPTAIRQCPQADYDRLLARLAAGPSHRRWLPVTAIDPPSALGA